MKVQTKLSFVWQGINGRYGKWKDGLYAAMKLLEQDYAVTYHEPTDEIDPDSIILYWEAPITIRGKDGENYRRIMNLPNKKILLFAGGQIQKEWVKGFDMLCVESKINADECEQLGIPYITAFGINENIFKPIESEKKYDSIHHGTSASWKRQWLLGEAIGNRALIVGRYQKEDPYPFDRCRELGCTVLDEHDPEDIAILINQSKTCGQTSEYWGGGQRCTLEAMACGVPVVCMSDSPKNSEYVEESGFGLVVDPDSNKIREAIQKLIDEPLDPKLGIEYIENKWTSRHYADNLRKAITSII